MKKWKVIIILDACRYDSFKKLYKRFLPHGVLKKKISNSVKTLEWLFRTFPKRYKDTIYISGNPYINSKIRTYYKGRSMFFREKFFKVIDTWDWGWNKEFGTVFPENIGQDFLKYYEKYPNKKFILHYIQPHLPYIPLLMREKELRIGFNKKIGFFMFDKPHLHKLMHLPFMGMFRNVGQKFFERVFKPKNPLANYKLLLKNFSQKSIRMFYEENLALVLSYVSDIVEVVNEPIITTSDHGELLGEHNLFGHSVNKKYKELVEVPELCID